MSTPNSKKYNNTDNEEQSAWIERRSGQDHQRGLLDTRNAYERDRTRAIHCPAFRRLQGKTQILGTKEGDFHRTRLTHSLEVASIGQSIVHHLALNNKLSKSNSNKTNHTNKTLKLSQAALSELMPADDLIHVICLLHDIGHPPFGHGGEAALNYMMRNHGGFEANGQTLRLLTKLEGSYGVFGLDLTRRTLLGLLKYPVPYSKALAPIAPMMPVEVNTTHKTIRVNDWLPPKAYFDSEQPEIDWLLSSFSQNDRDLFQSFAKKPEDKKHGKARFYSFDCSIMNIADDIAYGIHDLEDAIHLHFINQNQFDNADFRALLAQITLDNMAAEKLLNQLFSRDITERKQAIGEMVNYLITATMIVENHPDFENPILQYQVRLQEEAEALLTYLMKAIYQHVIDSQEARIFEFGGLTVILRLFDAFSANPSNLLDKKNRALFQAASDEKAALRVISDYIASMTDEYAYRMHERLFGFNTRTIFERL
jgi:dGTPase